MTGPQIMLDVFRSRVDRILVRGRGETSVASREDMLERIAVHLRGAKRIGFYNALPDSTVLWTMVDFQSFEGDPYKGEQSIRFMDYLRRAGLWGYRERSKSGGDSYHVWVFFQSPVAVRKVWLLVETLRERSHFDGIVLTSPGDEFDPRKGFAWLPLFGGRDEFYDPTGIPKSCYGIKDGATAFVDEGNSAFRNQWKVLLEIKRIPETRLDYAVDLLKLPRVSHDGFFVPEGVDSPTTAIKYVEEKCSALRKILSDDVIDADNVALLSGLYAGLRCSERFGQVMEQKPGYTLERVQELLNAGFYQPFPSCEVLHKVAGVECDCEEELPGRLPPWTCSERKWIRDVEASSERWRKPSPANWYFRAT